MHRANALELLSTRKVVVQVQDDERLLQHLTRHDDGPHLVVAVEVVVVVTVKIEVQQTSG